MVQGWDTWRQRWILKKRETSRRDKRKERERERWKRRNGVARSRWLGVGGRCGEEKGRGRGMVAWQGWVAREEVLPGALLHQLYNSCDAFGEWDCRRRSRGVKGRFKVVRWRQWRLPNSCWLPDSCSFD